MSSDATVVVPLIPASLPLDFDDLPTSQKRSLLKHAMWQKLKARLRAFTLLLRSEGLHLSEYLESAAHDYQGALPN